MCRPCAACYSKTRSSNRHLCRHFIRAACSSTTTARTLIALEPLSSPPLLTPAQVLVRLRTPCLQPYACTQWQPAIPEGEQKLCQNGSNLGKQLHPHRSRYISYSSQVASPSYNPQASEWRVSELCLQRVNQPQKTTSINSAVLCVKKKQKRQSHRNASSTASLAVGVPRDSRFCAAHTCPA